MNSPQMRDRVGENFLLPSTIGLVLERVGGIFTKAHPSVPFGSAPLLAALDMIP